MERIAVTWRLVSGALLLAGIAACTNGSGGGSNSLSQTVVLSDLQFSAPAAWKSLSVSEMMNTQESIVGLMGSVSVHNPCRSSADSGCTDTPFKLSGNGVGVIVVRSGNLGIRDLPSGPGYKKCADIADMACVRREWTAEDRQTHAERTMEWTLRPSRGDLVRITARIAGDSDQDTLAKNVVESMRIRS